MAFLYFLGALLGGFAALMLLIKAFRPGLRGPVTTVVQLGTANGDSEEALWRAALSSAGVWYRVQRSGWIPGIFVQIPYTTQFWVTEADYDFARKVIGL